MKPVLLFLAFCVSGLSAEASERVLTGDEIRSLLPTIKAMGGNTAQTFDEGGNTDYFTGGRLSKGRWTVQGDKYCSIWPPVTDWRCYGVSVDRPNKKIFWISENGQKDSNRIELRGE